MTEPAQCRLFHFLQVSICHVLPALTSLVWSPEIIMYDGLIVVKKPGDKYERDFPKRVNALHVVRMGARGRARPLAYTCFLFFSVGSIRMYICLIKKTLMSFQYSSFISYRHNELEKKFFLNLKNVLAKEIFFVTNKAQAFYDIEAIDWGQRWDDKIYSGIGDSYFFLPVWYYHYLNENNLWCARELYHALEIEKIIRDQLDPADQKNFFFIFPLIYRGDTSLIPECLSKISAMPLNNLEIDIRNNKDTTRLTNFKRAMNNLLLKNFRILEKYKIDFQQLFSAIPRPTDDQIKEWIKAQKDFINKQEASRLPRITKNEE